MPRFPKCMLLLFAGFAATLFVAPTQYLLAADAVKKETKPAAVPSRLLKRAVPVKAEVKAAPAKAAPVKVVKQPAPAKPAAKPKVKVARSASAITRLRAITKAEEKIEKALGEPTELEFVDTPLKDAIAYLSDYHNIPIIFDEGALIEEGFDTQEPVNRVLKGIKLSSALNILLDRLGLTYVIENEIIIVTTELDAEEKLTLSIYDVRKLVKAGMTEDALIETVKSHTHGPWQEGGAISTLSGSLVVSQTERTHQKILALLQLLEKTVDHSAGTR